MSTFAYKAIDSNGRQTADRLVAPDRTAAIEQLCNRDLNPVSVEKVEDKALEHLYGGPVQAVIHGDHCHAHHHEEDEEATDA